MITAGRTSRFGVIGDIIKLANPVFVLLAIFIPIGALVYASNFGSLTHFNYVHVLIGGLWTGIDLFMGFVLGPVLGGMEPGEKAAVFKRLIPRMTFLMPVLAGGNYNGRFHTREPPGYLTDKSEDSCRDYHHSHTHYSRLWPAITRRDSYIPADII